jgi:hypothetical protein
VEVVPSDDDSTVHLGRDDSTGKHTTTDRDKTNKRALLVNVRATDSLLRGLESETNVLVPSLRLALNLGLGVLENMRLLKLACV